MKRANLIFVLLTGLCSGLHANAAESLLRVACDGADIGSEIYINGKFKGECPLDISVSEGTLKLLVVKRIDALRESTFEQNVRIGEGVAKKVEVVLSAPRLNAAAQKREDARLQAEREVAAKREAEARERDAVLLAQQRKAAAAGDSMAMVAIADRYMTGTGVPSYELEAYEWYRKAIDAGNDLARFKVSNLYKYKMKKTDSEIVLKILGAQKGPAREVMVKSNNEIRDFIEDDPFFAIPDGTGQSVSYSYDYERNGYTFSDSFSCTGKGRFAYLEQITRGPVNTSDGDGSAVLGGLVPENNNLSAGFFNTITQKLVQITSVSGQPFPLEPGNRFDVDYILNENGGTAITKLSCTVIGQDKNIACFSETDYGGQLSTYALSKHQWNDKAGCFATSYMRKYD